MLEVKDKFYKSAPAEMYLTKHKVYVTTGDDIHAGYDANHIAHVWIFGEVYEMTGTVNNIRSAVSEFVKHYNMQRPESDRIKVLAHGGIITDKSEDE